MKSHNMKCRTTRFAVGDNIASMGIQVTAGLYNEPNYIYS